MKISKRLKMSADLVPPCSLLADIGTDHGYLPVYCVSNGAAERAIACDISPVSCEKARQNTEEAGLSAKIEVRVGNGLSPLKSEEKADVIVLSGMGGVLITQILEEGKEAVKKAYCLILQPQHNIDKVREYVLRNGFKITAEKITRESGKYYFSIRCERGIEAPYSPLELYFGKFLPNSGDVFKDYLNAKIYKFETALKKAEETNPDTDVTKLEIMLKMFKEVYEICQNAEK